MMSPTFLTNNLSIIYELGSRFSTESNATYSEVFIFIRVMKKKKEKKKKKKKVDKIMNNDIV